MTGNAEGGIKTARSPGERGLTLLNDLGDYTLRRGIVMVLVCSRRVWALSGRSRDATESAIYARQRMDDALLVPNPVEGRKSDLRGKETEGKKQTAFVPAGSRKDITTRFG